VALKSSTSYRLGKMIVIEAARAKIASALGKRDLNRFLASATEALGLTGEFSVLLTGDRRLRALNLQFRSMDKPTDVLSFPALSKATGGGQGGDLAISLETAALQAEEYGHTLQMEVKILILHGLLHLAGYDHERDQGQMRRRETLLRRRFALPAGLVERTLAEHVQAGRGLPPGPQRPVASVARKLAKTVAGRGRRGDKP
jgi:probable rRNA maturation factor